MTREMQTMLDRLRQGPVPVVTRGEINRTQRAIEGLRELGYKIEKRYNNHAMKNEFHLVE